MSAATLPGLLLERAAQTPDKVALRTHGHGIWTPTTWSALLARVERVGDGLASLGVSGGSRVAIVAPNRVEWIVADLAAQGLGAATLAIDPDTSPAEVASTLRAAGVVAIVLADQEQFDKIEAVGPDVPLIVMDTRGIRHLDDARRDDADRRLTFAQLEGRGSSGAWRSAAGAVVPSTAATVRVDAHGAVHHDDHASVLAAGERIAAAIGLGPHDELLPQHTFAHPVERAMAITGALAHGASLSIGQDDRLASLEAAAAQPTLVHAAPKWAAILAANLERRIAATTGLKKLALARGYRLQEPASTARSSRIDPLRALGTVAAVAVFVALLVTTSLNDWVRIAIALGIVVIAAAVAILSGISVPGPLRRMYGLGRARAVIVSDPIPEASLRVLGALGLPVISVDRP
jgi:long-chain acyl-CoA synthetase